MMTEEVMYQLHLRLSQTNTRGDFEKGIINNFEVAFDSCPSVLEGLQLGVRFSLMERIAMAKISNDKDH
jgi:hypothetical protein